VPYPSCPGVVENVDVAVLILRKQVPVHAEREGRRVVAALLLHVVDRLAGRDELARAAMSEVVNAHLADLGVCAERFSDAIAKVVAVHRRLAVSEHVAVKNRRARFGEVGLGSDRETDDGTAHAVEPRFEGREELCREVDGALLVIFRRGELAADPVYFDAGRLGDKINIAPADRQRFAEADPGACQELDEIRSGRVRLAGVRRIRGRRVGPCSADR
jgi:hypothetical protein